MRKSMSRILKIVTTPARIPFRKSIAGQKKRNTPAKKYNSGLRDFSPSIVKEVDIDDESIIDKM